MEDQAKMVVSGNEVAVQWLVRWAAMLVSRYLVGKDGRTGYERRRGRKCTIPCVPFGEVVWYREVRQNKYQVGKLSTEMKEGIWLGHATQTNEILIGTEEGVIRVYDVKRKEEGPRWEADKIRNMKGTPRQPNPSRPGGYTHHG